MKHLTGLIAAPHTPFRHDGSIALDVVPQQARLLAHNGVTGAFICGTTGEGSSLTSEERRTLVESWVAARPVGLPVIVHVGHLSLKEACALARHAEAAGADAIATIAPSFFKPPTVTELVAWCAKVARAAPTLPFYYYYMPGMTDVNIPATEFLALAGDQIPNLAGVKFTHENLMDFARSTDHADAKYNVLFGRDEILLAALALGARGAVGSTYNYAAPIFHKIMAAFDRGDLVSARRDQARVMDFVAVLDRHGGLAAGKCIMKLIGVDCGPVRLPLRALTTGEENTLRDALDQIGFFDYASALPDPHLVGK